MVFTTSSIILKYHYIMWLSPTKLMENNNKMLIWHKTNGFIIQIKVQLPNWHSHQSLRIVFVNPNFKWFCLYIFLYFYTYLYLNDNWSKIGVRHFFFFFNIIIGIHLLFLTNTHFFIHLLGCLFQKKKKKKKN